MTADELVDEPIDLADLAVMLEHAADDLGLLEEALSAARHAVDDHAARLELYAIADRTARAWAEARLALTGLREYVAAMP